MPTTSNTIKLKVLDRIKGFAKMKSSFILEYEGERHKVPMFEFQEAEPSPETLTCNIDNGVISQNIRTLYDRFYPDLNKTYLFKVKNKWNTLKYYEIVDPRIDKDDRWQRLLFNESTTDLEVGQLISCSIKSIRNSQLILHLADKNPSLIEFHDMDAVFNTESNENIKEWLDGLLEKNFMVHIPEHTHSVITS